VGFAAVDDIAVVGGQHIIHQRSVSLADRLSAAAFDRPELEAARGDGGAERAGADPGEADARGNDDEEADPQRERPPAVVGSMGGFGDGHGVAVSL